MFSIFLDLNNLETDFALLDTPFLQREDLFMSELKICIYLILFVLTFIRLSYFKITLLGKIGRIRQENGQGSIK